VRLQKAHAILSGLLSNSHILTYFLPTMPSIAYIVYYAAVVAWGASLYQFFLKDFLAVTVGLGRVVQTIDEFPFECRRLVHERLEACEDLWIDEEKRVLYAACTGTEGKLAWCAA
jgi:hypothetical protein